MWRRPASSCRAGADPYRAKIIDEAAIGMAVTVMDGAIVYIAFVQLGSDGPREKRGPCR
jgi:hypothetical protein